MVNEEFKRLLMMSTMLAIENLQFLACIDPYIFNIQFHPVLLFCFVFFGMLQTSFLFSSSMHMIVTRCSK